MAIVLILATLLAIALAWKVFKGVAKTVALVAILIVALTIVIVWSL